MTIRIILGCFVLAFGAFLLEIADTARAADGPLDQIGGVCVPDGVTIREGLYERADSVSGLEVLIQEQFDFCVPLR